MNDIILENICKSYHDNTVLQDLSVRFPAGKFSCIMGPSGSGKTTLLHLLMGIEQPDSGRISGMPRDISVVFQEDRLCEELTVEKNLRLVTGSKVAPSHLASCLSDLGLENSLREIVKNLSGGMKRRVSLARALLASYQVLLLDEPFKGLDEVTKHQVLTVLLRYAEGKTVIFVTHDQTEAAFFGASVFELPAK